MKGSKSHYEFPEPSSLPYGLDLVLKPRSPVEIALDRSHCVGRQVFKIKGHKKVENVHRVGFNYYFKVAQLL